MCIAALAPSFIVLAGFLPLHASARTAFECGSAGDMGERSAVLWARARDPLSEAGRPLVAEVSTDGDFRQLEFRGSLVTDPARDFTAKIEATGLAPGRQHFYRFRAEDGSFSGAGSFRTAPAEAERRGVRFAFSGDTDGRWRPYPALQGISERKLDFFVFLGDTMYESASGRPSDGPPRHSPAATDPFRDPVQALADYHRKYLENIRPVNSGGIPGLCELFESTGRYVLLDNHELGNGRAQSGGASADPGTLSQGPDATPGPPYMNHTEAFRTLVRAYADYQPIRERLVEDAADPRADGTLRLWYEQRWGKLLTFVNLDDRSYRDVRLKKLTGGDDTGERADNPRRTMLGGAQLAWAKRTLALAQKDGVTWKVVAVSSPIDENGGDLGDAKDGGKSWAGGYRAERSDLLGFIAREGIENVVFLSTDDHVFRVNELFYTQAAPGSAQARQAVPHAFTIVAGPMGAGGPDVMMNHAVEGGPGCPSAGPIFTLEMPAMGEHALADCIASHQERQGLAHLGLRADFPGLSHVAREGHAENSVGPVDFFSRDTFNYCELSVDAASANLHVELRGIRAYPASSFPEPDPSNPVHTILSFEIAPAGSPNR